MSGKHLDAVAPPVHTPPFPSPRQLFYQRRLPRCNRHRRRSRAETVSRGCYPLPRKPGHWYQHSPGIPSMHLVPLQFHSLVCIFNGEGHQIVSVCASTLQLLNFEGSPVSSPPVPQTIRNCLVWRTATSSISKLIQFPSQKFAPLNFGSGNGKT